MTMQVLKTKVDLVNQAIRQIEKQFGEGSIMKLGGDGPRPKIQTYTTGSLAIDRALGIGGIPVGRITEVFGPESSGKTTLTLHTIAQRQRAGGVCAFIDAEHAFDIRYAEALGIDANLLLVSQPDNGEQALEICETLIRSGAVDLVVLDSVAALVPKAEIEGEMGDHHMGLQARLMSQAMRKLTGIISRTGCALILINQLRQKIGVVFGNPEVTTGGNALKFYSSIRIEVRRIGSLKSNGETNGHRTRVRIVKNKMAPPFRDAEVDMIYGRGIVRSLELIDLALSEDILQRSGNWISFDSVRLGQGRDKASRFLESNSEIMKEVEVKLMGDTPEDSPNQPEKKKRQKAA